MPSFRLLFYISLLQDFYTFGLCGEQKFGKSLVLTKYKREFTATVPYDYDPETKIARYKAPGVGETYHFCQTSIKWNQEEFVYLAKSEHIKRNTEFDDSPKCDEIAKEILVKVYNPREWKNVRWNYDEMELYHSGFMAKTDRSFFAKAREFNMFVRPKAQYLVPNLNFDFIPMIELYNNMIINQIQAAEYKLVSTDIPYRETIFNIGIIPSLYYEEELNIFECTDSKDYAKCFEKILNEDCIAKFRETAKDNKLTTIMFAPTQHFPIPMWRYPCQTYINFFPMWMKPKLTWQKVDTFARVVAKYIGDLNVIVGITGEMTLCDTVVQDKYAYKLPEYYWKVFAHYNGRHNYAIIVVLNYNSFKKTEKKMCTNTIDCQANGWMIANDDYETGEVYCCPMTRQNIKALDKPYLGLQKSQIFNLYNWGNKIDTIKKEYEVELHRQKHENDETNDSEETEVHSLKKLIQAEKNGD